GMINTGGSCARQNRAERLNRELGLFALFGHDVERLDRDWRGLLKLVGELPAHWAPPRSWSFQSSNWSCGLAGATSSPRSDSAKVALAAAIRPAVLFCSAMMTLRTIGGS